MKVSREQMAANREKILQAAAQLFRERGFESVSVAEVMQVAGLTHGGFYGHFPSKEALAAEAAAYALAQTNAWWNGLLQQSGRAGLREAADSYLSKKHRDHPGAGCAIAALGPEIARLGAPAQEIFGNELDRQITMLAAFMPAKTAEQKREKAAVLLAQMVGAMVISRVLGKSALSEEVLATTRKSLEI